MKRIAIAFLAAVIGAGALETGAEARGHRDHHGDKARQHRVSKKMRARIVQRNRRVVERRVERRTRPWNRRGHVVTSHRQVQPRWHSHPVYRSIRSSNRVLLRSSYSGGRYLSVNRWYEPSAIRFIDLNPDGSYDVWFNGNVYRAYDRYYDGHRSLYLGSAPTGLGFQFQIVLY